MPTLNKYALSNEKRGYFIRANVGGSHPVTLQVTGTAEQIFEDNGYSDGSNIPTKLVWSMYDVDLVYTESSVSGSTPSHSFDSFSDAVTGSKLTKGTREELIRYFRDYSGSRRKQVDEVLSELRREVTAGSIETYDSSKPVQNAGTLLRKYSSKSGDEIEQFIADIGERARQSLLVFGQRASQINDIRLAEQSAVAYQFAPLSVTGEVTVFDLTTDNQTRDERQYEYRIEFPHKRKSPIYVRNGAVQNVSGTSSRSSEARQLAEELTPVEINKNDIRSTVDSPGVSEMYIPDRAFIQGDSELIVGVVDRISGSGNPLVELERGHLLLDSGQEDGVYLIDRINSQWGRVLCELTHGDDAAAALADTMPLLDADAFRDTDIEHDVVDAARLYHDTQNEIVAAKASDDGLEYWTRAVLTDGSAGPLCGLSVGDSTDDATVIEVFVHPDDETRVLEYGESGICHRVVLMDGVSTWKTAVSPDFEDLPVESRGTLLTHQVEVLQIVKETLDAHAGCESDSLIADVVDSGDLEQGIEYSLNLWKGSDLTGGPLSESGGESTTEDDEKCTGTVDFFNDTGGYGFIETKVCEEDVFYHMEDIGGPDITEGEELRFNIDQAEKGPRAKNVERM